MPISRRVTRIVCLVALAAAASCPAQQAAHRGGHSVTTASRAAEGSARSAPVVPMEQLQLLPPAFASLPRQGDIVTQPSASSLDSAHAAVLKEDGFVNASRAVYSGNGGTGWTVEVLRFGDATGAYSAFTFYRSPQMHAEAVGDDAAADPDLFLVRTSATLVMVRPSATSLRTPSSSAALLPAVKTLVRSLPRRHGPDDIAPSLPGLMPAAGLDRMSLHYAEGPGGYNGPIPVQVIDFSRDAETAAASYRLSSAPAATLTLIMLPTPQIAVAQQRAIAALPDASLRAGMRRFGPLLGVVSGAGVSPAAASTLLGRVHYVSNVTIDQPQGYTSQVELAAKLLLGIAYLTVALSIAAVVLAVFFGAGRVLLRRLQGKPDSSMHDDDFIRLKL